MTTIYLFTYGTLRKEQRNKHYLKDCEYIGTKILRGYKMFSNGSYPMILADGKSSIVGEIYKLDTGKNPFVLQSINNLERDYHRVIEKVIFNNEEIEINLYIWKWIFNLDRWQEVKTGDWIKEIAEQLKVKEHNKISIKP